MIAAIPPSHNARSSPPKAAATAATGMGFAPNLVAAAADAVARAVLVRRAIALCARTFAACRGYKAVLHDGASDQAPST